MFISNHHPFKITGQRTKVESLWYTHAQKSLIKHGGEVGWFEERGAVEPGEDRSNLPATSAGAAIYSKQDIGTGGGKE